MPTNSLFPGVTGGGTGGGSAGLDVDLGALGGGGANSGRGAGSLLDADSNGHHSRTVQLALELALLQGQQQQGSGSSSGFDSPPGGGHPLSAGPFSDPATNPLLHPFGVLPGGGGGGVSSANGVGGSLEDLKTRRSQNMTECVPVPTSEHVAEIVGRQGKTDKRTDTDRQTNKKEMKKRLSQDSHHSYYSSIGTPPLCMSGIDPRPPFPTRACRPSNPPSTCRQSS